MRQEMQDLADQSRTVFRQKGLTCQEIHCSPSESSGLDLRGSAGLKHYGAPLFSTARLLLWPDCMVLIPRDSLALGDKGHEYMINGPRSRPQGPHVWPHL